MSRLRRTGIAALASLVLAACVASSTFSPEVVRLQDELARVEADDRIGLNADPELDEARRAVDALVDHGRRFDEVEFDHALYLADRLIAIAAAEGLARHAQERARALSTEREILLIDARTRQARAQREASEARVAAEEADEAEAGGEPEGEE